jgi:hypothetical protein
MHKLFLILVSILVLTIGGPDEITTFNNSTSIDCPKCTVEFESCSAPLNKAYIEAVEKAADSLNGDKISRLEYSNLCSEARKVKNKEMTNCTATYNKCCLAETKEELEKSKKEKQ